jgi:hypothetical protein
VSDQTFQRRHPITRATIEQLQKAGWSLYQVEVKDATPPKVYLFDFDDPAHETDRRPHFLGDMLIDYVWAKNPNDAATAIAELRLALMARGEWHPSLSKSRRDYKRIAIRLRPQT